MLVGSVCSSLCRQTIGGGLLIGGPLEKPKADRFGPRAPSEGVHSLTYVAAEAFSGHMVRKDLVRRFGGQFPVPTYVVEFMLGRYCASTEPSEIEDSTPTAGLHATSTISACQDWTGTRLATPKGGRR